MNSKQFVSSAVCLLFENHSSLRKTFGGIVNFLYPHFERIPLFPKIKSALKNPNKLSIYLVLFLFLFVIQAVWAFVINRFYFDDNPFTKNFLEDWVDILNYSIICEAYIILGIEFLSRKYFIYENLKASNFLPSDFKESKLKYNGLIGTSFVLIIATTISIGYTLEVNSYSNFYWFMYTPPPNVTFAPNGYFYLFMNQLLSLLVIWVAASHFGLFQVSGVLANYLRNIFKSSNKEELQSQFQDENDLKKRLSPFSELILISKAFVLVITINLLLWKFNQPEIKPMYELAVLFTAIFGIWVFALPRYFIQYHIFLIWRKMEKHDYKDLRMPWIVGFSATIDIILITILIKVLLGDAISNLFHNLFS